MIPVSGGQSDRVDASPAEGGHAVGDGARTDGAGTPSTQSFAELDRLLGAAAAEVDRGLEDGAARIGRYTLVSQVGEGGFGAVWLASQQVPVRRLVALKILRRDPGSRMVLVRFQNERQALARMDHPNVATVLDAGVTEDGRPWFAMPYIDGLPINQHCDAERLTVRERVRLLAETCDGVHHAHQKGIIHRDLKPGNVLVQRGTVRSVPKVIDFGVAKAVEGSETPSVATMDGQRLGTPQYMPPEQWVHGATVADVRSDVYALGAVLAELLVGGPPTKLPRTPLESPEVVPPVAWLAQQRAADPVSASRVAQCRHCGTELLAEQVAGDLDAIVRKATAAHPADRYASAAALADDLRRWLDGQPVAARMLAPWEHAVRLARRNRFASAVAAVAVLALVVAAVLLLNATVVARAQRNAAEAAQERSDRSLELATGMLQDLLARQAKSKDPAETRDAFVRAEGLVDSIGRTDPIVAGRLAAIVGAGHMASWERRAAYGLLRRHFDSVLARESDAGARESLREMAVPLHRQALAYDRPLASAIASLAFESWIADGLPATPEARHRLAVSFVERVPWPINENVHGSDLYQHLAHVYSQFAPTAEEAAMDLASLRIAYFVRAPGEVGAMPESAAARQRIIEGDPPESRRRLLAELQEVICRAPMGRTSPSDIDTLQSVADRAAVALGRWHPVTVNARYNLACTCSAYGFYEAGWYAYRPLVWDQYQRSPDDDPLRRWTLGFMSNIAFQAGDSDAAFEMAQVELWDDERLAQVKGDDVQRLAAATLAAVLAERGDEAGARAIEATYRVARAPCDPDRR